MIPGSLRHLIPTFTGFVLATAVGAGGSHAQENWIGGGSGSWNDPSNWASGTVPNGSGVSARVAPVTTSGANVQIQAPISLGDLVLSGFGPVHLLSISSSTGSITFDAPSGTAALRATGSAGTFMHSIHVPLILVSDLEVTTTPNIDLAITGPISGAGALTKDGSSTLFLTSANSYSGGTTIREGRLTVSSMTLPGNVTNNGILDFLQVSDGTFSGIISGSGNIFKRGSGVLTLTAANPITGTAGVSDGELRILGSLGGRAIVSNPHSFLSGTGSVGSLTSVNGNVAPGTSIGTLSVLGNAQFLRSPRLLAEIDPNGAQKSDLLSVGGAVTGINNLQIVVNPLASGLSASAYVAANDYTVLTAGSIDGDTPTIIEGGDLPALVDVSIVGQPSASGQVTLRFTELPVSALLLHPAVTTTGNPNHATLVSAVVNTPGSQQLTGGTTLTAATSTLTNNQLAAFNAVHAEPYSSHLTVGLEHLNQVADTALSNSTRLGVPLRERFGGRETQSDPKTHHRLWMDAAFVGGRVVGQAGVGNFGYRLLSAVFGGDIVSTQKFTGGLFIGGGNSFMGEHDSVEQTFDTKSVFTGLYGHVRFAGGAALSAMAGYSYGSTSSARKNPSLGAFTGGTATANFDSHAFVVGAELQKRFEIAGLSLTPSASVKYARIYQNQISETGGGDFNYTIDSAFADSLVTSVGLDLVKPLGQAAQNWSLLAFGRYDFDWFANARSHHSVRATSPLFGQFNQIGQNRGAHGFHVGVGLSYRYGNSLDLDFRYTFSHRLRSFNHRANTNLAVRF